MTERSPGFPGARRQPIPVSTSEWVRPVADSPRLPLHVSPVVDVDLAAWAGQNASTVDGWLHEHGAVLFRGFGVRLDAFGSVANALAGTALPYRERSSPRTELAAGVYSSTDYPADQPIPLHNENSYQHVFPARLVFGCIVEPAGGGATPLADTRRVLGRIDPAIVQAFRERQVCYARSYGAGLGMSWSEAFQETDPIKVGDYCHQAGIELEWRQEGGLRTRQVRPAVAVHPRTGQPVWFNHAAFFHVSSLEPALADLLLAQFGEADLPANTYYGDGAPIEPATLANIRAAYAAEKVATPWREGDVLLVDNLLCAHGREPFTGPRRVVVSMAGALDHESLPALAESMR